jgi:hypothetical protein
MCHLQLGRHPKFCGAQRSTYLSNVTRLGTDAYTIVYSEESDCNQRLITYGLRGRFCQPWVSERGSLASWQSREKAGRQLRSFQPALKAATPWVQPQPS